ncbi:MAG: sulfurtransferase [Methylovulum sp.]|uniref:sulfurtransferase n=1 Tax=Methylovulum sp. TaxID=1916980 RepID=UPI00261101DB|nr:sulfurtransferase [Methylovulum sp.]MDD2723033.1 sulfurtransferase [Methylovulum sp.]MDD5124775.1 sulfurtransferase [Methylovulum sp.]
MNYTTLISAADLQANLANPDWTVVDCRFSLADTEAGHSAYRFGHLPNARYADLNQDLSSQITDQTGRHPLPDVRALANKLGTWGIANHTQVVVYDDASGAFAGRLWWLLRWLGHDKVAVLDGGSKHWQQLGLPITTILPKVKPVVFRPYLNTSGCLDARALENGLATKKLCLLDARTPERYRGEQEPIDPVAGHIPGALNRPFQQNLAQDGLFLPPAVLRQQFSNLIGNYSPDAVVHNCGSGVTACHNLLAMEHAGLRGSSLYAGSWSEWIRDANRAVAVG